MGKSRLVYEQERFGLPGLASVLTRVHLARCLAECGAFAEGRPLAEEGIRIAEAADHPLYCAMEMTFWLPQAEATLAQVSALA